MTKHTDSSRLTDSGVSGKRFSSAPTSPEMTLLSGEQAEERTAREGRKRAEEWIAEQAIYETPCPARRGQMIENYRLTDLLTAYAESECSRLASRVEELENLIAKQSGSLTSADSASNTESSSTAKETR